MADFVADASAMIEWFMRQPGADRVAQILRGGSVALATPNLAEVLGKVAQGPWALERLRRRLLGLGVRIVPLESADAMSMAAMRSDGMRLGMGLGDLACIAVGRRLGATVVTTDAAWLEFAREQRDLSVWDVRRDRKFPANQ